jgi:mannose-6-phosphate isomerase-like protein (cupin superfamily)
MADYTVLTGEDWPPPTVPKPDTPPEAAVVTVQDGLPVIYGDEVPGAGIRVVHPTNPNAPSKNHGVGMLYMPPHAKMALHSHETEETYVILEGSATMAFWNRTQHVSAGDFIYLPAWCEHGIENTGTDPLVVLLATSPPNP